MKYQSIVVRGAQRKDIDADLLAQVLLSVARDMSQPPAQQATPDVFEAAIEEREAS